jgi:hypothetical protein
MNLIPSAKEFLRELVGSAPHIVAVPKLRKKVERADLPLCYIQTQQGLWSHDSTQTYRQLRTFRLECLVDPLPNDLAHINEEFVDEIIEGIIDLLYKHQIFGDGSMVHMDNIEDSGLLIIDHGTLYYGFTMDIPILLR